MPKILIDTNFLLVPAQFKVDIFEELSRYGTDFVVLDRTMWELEIIGGRRGRNGIYARVASDLLKKHSVEIIETDEKNTDTAILKFAEKHGCMVATNDRKLIKRLKNKGIKIIRLRQKKYLMME